jgi:hypothetical protein
MARKTVEIATVRDTVNRMLAAPNGTAEGRRALAVLAESILMSTGNYRGFGYLPSELSAPGVLRDGYDDTRRRYS